MTKQELMVNRYEVIADYPDSPFEKGDIYTIKNDCSKTQVENPEKYPKIFRKLEWYEKRTIEEMPEYLKIVKVINNKRRNGEIFKAVKGALTFHNCGYQNSSYDDDDEFCSGFDNVILSCFEPATEEEYLSYLKDSK